MADDATDKLKAEMKALRAEYLAESPERVRELSEALGRLRARDAAALGDLHRYFHRLAGSGGSYGFAEITTRSREAEHAVASIAAETRLLERADFALLEQHVLAVADAFRNAQRTFAADASN